MIVRHYLFLTLGIYCVNYTWKSNSIHIVMFPEGTVSLSVMIIDKKKRPKSLFLSLSKHGERFVLFIKLNINYTRPLPLQVGHGDV